MEILGTLFSGAVVLGIVALAVWSMVRDKRQGKSLQCGGDCRKCKGCH